MVLRYWMEHFPDESHTLDYHNLKGRIYLTVNEDEKALEHLVLWLHAIQKLRPDGTKKTTRQMARLGYAYYTIASAKADMILDGKEGNLSEVMNDIEKAVAAEKDVSQKVSYYHTAADIWRRKKEYAKMFDICDKMLAIDPQYYPAYLLRQEACLYLGRYQEVVNDYQRATTLYISYKTILYFNSDVSDICELDSVRYPGWAEKKK